MVNILEPPSTRQKPSRLPLTLVVAAPLADAIASALHPSMPDDPAQLLAVVDRTGRWYAMSVIGLVASGLVAAGAIVLGRSIREKAPVLGTVAMVATFAGAVLMAGMQGFKLFLPTLADVAPDAGAAAVAGFLESASFAPMIGAFLLRALGYVLFGVAAAKGRIVPWPVGLLVALGAVLAFQLPAGPDALGWVLVAIGVGVIGWHRVAGPELTVPSGW